MKKQFTLIELLAVITILGILMGLAGAAIPLVLNKAYTLTCANNMKNLGDSAQAYASGGGLSEIYPGGGVVHGKSWVARLALLSDNVTPDSEGNYITTPNKKTLGMFTCTRDNGGAIVNSLASGEENNGEALSLALSYTFNAGPADVGLNFKNRDVSKSIVKAPASTAYLIETHGASDATQNAEADPADPFILGIDLESVTIQSPNVLYKKDPRDATNKEFSKSRVISFISKIKSDKKEFIEFDGRTNGVRGHGKESSPSMHVLMYDGSVELVNERLKTDYIKYRK